MGLLKSATLLTALGLLICATEAQPLVKRTAVDKSPPPEICIGGTPCGWAVYNKTTREVNDFWKNRCVCNSTSKCVRDYDQLATTTYIYRCRPSEDSQ